MRFSEFPNAKSAFTFGLALLLSSSSSLPCLAIESKLVIASPASDVPALDPVRPSINFQLYEAVGLKPPAAISPELVASNSFYGQPLFNGVAQTDSVTPPVLNSLQQAAVDASSKEILKQLIAIQRLNTTFRMASTSQPKWRQLRQSTYVETNATCTLSGTIDAMRLHYANIAAPARIYSAERFTAPNGNVTTVVTSKLADARKIRAALSQGIQEPQVVGNCVNLCGDIFELGVNANRWRQLRTAGLNSRSYRKRILVLSKKLDAAFDERDLLVRELPDGIREAEYAQYEGKLQHDLRDLLLVEYAHYHQSSSRSHWFQNAAYLLDFAKNSTGAAGGIISIEGNHLRHARWSGGAAIFTTISGTLTLMIPFAGRVAGNWASTVDRHIVSRDYGRTVAASTSDITQHQNKFTTALKESTESPQSASASSLRLFGYEQIAQIVRDHETDETRLQRRAKKVTIENAIYGGVIGSTKVSLGVCGILAGYRYYNRPWLSSRLTAAGNTAYTAGTGFAILENIRVVGTQHFSDERLRAQHLLPSQQYRQRLTLLDRLDTKIQASELAK